MKLFCVVLNSVWNNVIWDVCACSLTGLYRCLEEHTISMFRVKVLCLLFDPVHGDGMFFQNVSKLADTYRRFLKLFLKCLRTRRQVL
jgi:hypothetical protein